MNDYTFITRRYILDFFTKNHEKTKRIEQWDGLEMRLKSQETQRPTD
nr:MAG TPA: hypothetical protein [Microviridae sp.]